MKRPLPAPLPALLLALAAPLAAATTNIRDHGATGDGVTPDTAAIQKAIDTCAATGGGTVLIPPGRYLAGTLTLKSHITLHLEAGATLLASPSMKDFPTPHLLTATDARDIAIEGRGAIDGNGPSYTDPDHKPIRPRPSPLLQFRNTTGLRIENITIANAPGWTIRPKNCDDVRIRGISLLNDTTLVNTDGLDIDSSRNVIISDCRIEAGDDCIVIKTTRHDETGTVQPVENVVVTNCILTSAASALKLGTESHADFRHILFDNCVIRDSRTGLALFCKDGATMEDIHFSNITMTTKPKWGKGWEWPIIVDIEKRAAQSPLGAIRDISFTNITINGKGRVTLTGLPERPLETITLRDIRYRLTGYEHNIDTATKLRGGAGKGIPGAPVYATLPAIFILANIDGITIDGLSLAWPAHPGTPPPARHIIAGENVRRPTFRNLDAHPPTPGTPPIALKAPPPPAP